MKLVNKVMVTGLVIKSRYSMLGKVDGPQEGMLNGEVYTTNSPRDPTLIHKEESSFRRYVKEPGDCKLVIDA